MPTATEAINSVHDAIQTRKQETAKRYLNLVQRLAAGEEIAGADVLDTLRDAGKAEDDLRHDLADVESVKQLPVIQKQIAEITKQRDKLASEVRKLEQQAAQIDATFRARRDELRAADGRLGRLRQQKTQLLQKFPEAIPEFADAKRQFRYYAQQATGIGQKLADAKERLIIHSDRSRGLESRQVDSYNPERKQQIVDAAEAVDKAQVEFNRLEKEHNTAIANSDDAKSRMNQFR